MEENFDAQIQYVKDEIEIRIESIRNEMQKAGDELIKELEGKKKCIKRQIK